MRVCVCQFPSTHTSWMHSQILCKGGTIQVVCLLPHTLNWIYCLLSRSTSGLYIDLFLKMHIFYHSWSKLRLMLKNNALSYLFDKCGLIKSTMNTFTVCNLHVYGFTLSEHLDIDDSFLGSVCACSVGNVPSKVRQMSFTMKQSFDVYMYLIIQANNLCPSLRRPSEGSTNRD